MKSRIVLSKYYLCCLILGLQIIFLNSTVSQSSGTNVIEFQFGKLPDETADEFPSIYDRTILQYKKKAFRVSATVEQFYSKFSERNYIDLSQALVQYKKKAWDIKVGNFYETIGRGLLLRGFEIRGAVIEELGFRSRNYFHRDMLGASVQYKTKKWTVQALRADVLNILPPTFDREARRVDIASVLSGEYRVYKKHKLGMHLLNHKSDNVDADNYFSLQAEGPISKIFNYHIEYAQQADDAGRRAVYLGLNGFVSNLSFSLELKDYKDFIIGSGINEPPALVQQFTYRTLNRSTHVPNPSDEIGYQLELSYGFKSGNILTFNHALARNKIGSTPFTFRQYFLEWSSQFTPTIPYRLFVDFSEDPFKGQDNRLTVGFYPEMLLSPKWIIIPELEWQRFDRDSRAAQNISTQLGISYKSKLILNILVESTTDPFLVRDNASRRNFLGAYLTIKPNSKNAIRLFGGERQGGPACNAGVCYEILDFKGFECRWTTRF